VLGSQDWVMSLVAAPAPAICCWPAGRTPHEPHQFESCTPCRIRRQAVAADGIRRIPVEWRMAPITVGGYPSMEPSRQELGRVSGSKPESRRGILSPVSVPATVPA
jgi:hypothetical protein